MQGFSLRPEQEMSASHRNMYYDGISYTALDLCAPWVLVQEACLQMKRQGTVHLVKHIHLLVVQLTRAARGTEAPGGERNRSSSAAAWESPSKQPARRPAGGVLRRRGERPVGESMRFGGVRDSTPYKSTGSSPVRAMGRMRRKPNRKTRPGFAFLAQLAFVLEKRQER